MSDEGGFRTGQPVWVIESDDSQRPAEYIGEGSAGGAGAEHKAFVIYVDTAGSDVVDLERLVPREPPRRALEPSRERSPGSLGATGGDDFPGRGGGSAGRAAAAQAWRRGPPTHTNVGRRRWLARPSLQKFWSIPPRGRGRPVCVPRTPLVQLARRRLGQLRQPSAPLRHMRTLLECTSAWPSTRKTDTAVLPQSTATRGGRAQGGEACVSRGGALPAGGLTVRINRRCRFLARALQDGPASARRARRGPVRPAAGPRG
jgi:hypothetical protein